MIYQRRTNTNLSLDNFMKLKAIAYHSLEDYGQVQVGITVDFRGPYHNELNVDLTYHRLSSLLFFSTFKLNRSASHISVVQREKIKASNLCMP